MTATDGRNHDGYPPGRTKRRRVLPIVLATCAAVLLFLAGLWTIIDRTNGHIVSGGRNRSYLLRVPASYDPVKAVPLIISLHGIAEWPALHMHISGWNEIADREGFIVVYPEGVGLLTHWSAGFGTRIPNTDMRDVNFISDLIDALMQDYNIDPERIYVDGFSNGGGLSYLVACELADRIAAIGSVSGAYLYPLDACQLARTVPLIAFHGTADGVVPYDGHPRMDLAVPFPAVPDWIAAWAGRGGCDPEPALMPAQGEVRGIRYTGCRDGGEVDFYTVDGGGHAWPGSDPLPYFISGHTTQDIDATAVMWEFFHQHPLSR